METPLAADEFSTLLLSLYRGAQEFDTVGHFQDYALELVKPLIRFNSCLWAGGAIDGPPWRPTVVHLHNQCDEVIHAYAEVAEQDLAVRILAQQVGGTVTFNAGDLFQGAACGGIREYTRRYEHENTTVSCAIDAEAQLVNWISLYRADPSDEFERGENSLVEQLSRHLFTAVSISRREHLLRILHTERGSNRSLAICDGRGHVHYAETGFWELLSQEREAEGHRLPPLILATLTNHGVFHGRAVTVRARLEGGLLFLVLRNRLPADSLSGRELQVVEQMAQGKTHKEIARALDLAPATVRTHIQRIYRKLSTRNTAELFRVLEAAGLRSGGDLS